jgi:large subunit ribosomal protein L31
MKEKIHPTYYPDALVTCACGNTWHTGSTKKEIRTDVCYKCHPFYTGEQRIVDTEGQVDRFYRKLQARQLYKDEAEARAAARVSPERPVQELELGTRATDALVKSGVLNTGQILDLLTQGEEKLLAIDGFGRKSLADVKKRLRQFGYDLPQNPDQIVS